MSRKPPDVNDLLEAVRAMGATGGHPGPGWYLTQELAVQLGLSSYATRRRLEKLLQAGKVEKTHRSATTGGVRMYWRWKKNGKGRGE